jgi:hypothetical protein
MSIDAAIPEPLVQMVNIEEPRDPNENPEDDRPFFENGVFIEIGGSEK